MYTEIQSYRIFIDSGSHKMRSFTTINLYDTSDNVIGVLQFHENEIQPIESKDFEHIHLQYPMSRFQLIVDILRNEKPIYIGYWKNQYGKYGRLCTGKEPVGEGEVETPLITP